MQAETITIEDGDIALVFRHSGGGELVTTATVDENGNEIVHVHLDELVKLSSVWFLARIAEVMNSPKPGEHPMMKAILIWSQQRREALMRQGIAIQSVDDYMAEMEVRSLIHGQEGRKDGGGDVPQGEPDGPVL